MRNLSTEFKEEQNNGNHRYLKFVDITLKNGTELHLDNSNLWSNGFTFEEAVSSGDNFDIGAAIINKFSVVINNIEEKFSEYVFSGAKAVVYVGLKLSTGIEKIRICTGTVSEEPRQKSSIITLTLLDNMSKFDRDYADVKTVFPATRNQIVRDICSHCGVTLQTVTFDNDDYIIQKRPIDEALTCRQMLAWVRVHIAECLHRIDNIRSFVGSKEHVNNDEKCIRNIEILKTSIAALEEYLRLKKKNGNDGWIPVSERLPEPDKMVVVTVHCSEWISDYDSDWVPENKKIHYDEEYLVSMGYVVNDLGDWAFFDLDGYEIPCDKEFGTDKGDFYSVVTAWRPFEELGPHKGGE